MSFVISCTDLLKTCVFDVVVLYGHGISMFGYCSYITHLEM